MRRVKVANFQVKESTQMSLSNELLYNPDLMIGSLGNHWHISLALPSQPQWVDMLLPQSNYCGLSIKIPRHDNHEQST